MRPELVVDVGADLGEGPCWDARTDELVFCDLEAGLLYRVAGGDGAVRTHAVGQPVGVAVPRVQPGYLVAARAGFGIVEDGTGFELVTPIPIDDDGQQTNDGKCDVAGRLWAGTYVEHDDVVGGAGRLHRLDPDGTVTVMLDGLDLPNGIDWSPDDTTMYLVDSYRREVLAFEFIAATGELRRRRVLIEVPERWGLADGLCVDAAGCLWVAFWDGFAVRRFDPNGTLLAQVPMPAARVTSCCFGGPDLDQLFVTSARSDDVQSGRVFRLRPGTRGRPTRPYAG